MSERFKIVSEQTYENILFRGFPVIPEKSRITYDNHTNKIVVQFKLVNVCSDIVDTVYIKADFYDVAKEVVASVDEHIISMVNVGHGVSFGDKSPLYMEDTRISGVGLVISKVVFKSGKVWKNEDNSTGEKAEPAKPLNISKNFKAQFNKETGKLRIQAECQFEDFGSYWRCSCGMLNTGDLCCICKAATENLRLVFSEESLTKRISEDNAEQRKQEYNKAVSLQESKFVEDCKEAVRIFESLSGYEDSAERIKQCGQRISEIEAEEAEKEAQREKERQEQAERLAKIVKKKKITVGIASGMAVAAVAFIVVLNTVIIPNNKYNNAVSLYESGNYDEAKSAF